MKTLLATLILLTAVLAVQSSLVYGKGAPDPGLGTVQVLVRDSGGDPLGHAPVYISRGLQTDVLESDASGSLVINLNAGDYAISAAINRQVDGWVDRFVSRIAKILVVSDDTASVILTLHPVEDPKLSISLTTLKKMGLDEEVAKNLD